MVDFTKLRDPEFKAKFKAKREAEDARQEALDKEVLEKLSVLEAHIESLSDKERSFFRSVRQRHLMWLDLSGPQKKWLDDIAARLLSPDDAGAARPRALGDQFRPD
jgi:hypothetical protein